MIAPTRSPSARRLLAVLLPGVLHLASVAPALAAQAPASGPRTGTHAVTYARDVAPIIQQKCQECHSPGSVAPMSLLTFDDVKQYALEIRQRVAARTMPPWHIDRTVGIQHFKNDRSLSDAQVATLLGWIDDGMPMGDPKELPPPITPPDPNRWTLASEYGAPDLIIRSTPYTLAARTQDKWFRPVVETGVTEPRWVRAIEVKPVRVADRRIVHHVLAYLLQDEVGVTGLASTAHDHQSTGGLFMEWAVGKTAQIFPDDAGKLMLPGSRIRWEVHMHANGEPVEDSQVEMAVYFYPPGYVPKHRTVLQFLDLSRGTNLDIPPGEQTLTQNFFVLQAPARLENFQPHMHMRGRAMSLEAVYPDGRKELISQVSDFQWNWHINYVYASDVAPLLPKGTVLVFTAWHDNTAANPNNPDPRQWVGWGDRTVDEMAHNWIDFTYLEQDEFAQMVAARKAAAAKPVPR